MTLAGATVFRTNEARAANQDYIHLKPLGSGQDDWPKLMEVAASYAYKGSIVMLPGEQGEDWLCKSVHRLPSGTTIIGTPGTRIVQCLPSGSGNALVAAFGSTYSAYQSGLLTQLSSAPTLGTSYVETAADIAPVGSYVVIINGGSNTFRQALHKVVAVSGSGPYTLQLDRPVRMAFAAGDMLFPAYPAQDITISGQGMTMTGTGARYIELLGALRCRVSDVKFVPDVGTVDERLVSIDIPSYDCVLERLDGNGGGTTELGISFESAANCGARDCVVHNCTIAGYIFQDAIECFAHNCSAYNNGIGAVLTSAIGNEDGCYAVAILNGEYAGNQCGVVVERGSSASLISGAQITNNVTGVLFGASSSPLEGNIITGCGIQKNFNGIELCGAAANTTIAACAVTENRNGVRVPPGASATAIRDVDVSGTRLAVSIASGCQVSGLHGVVSDPEATCLVLLSAGAELNGSGIELSAPPAPLGFVNVMLLLSGASASLDSVNLKLGTQSNGIALIGDDALVCVRNTAVSPIASATGTTGIYASSGTVRIGEAVNSKSCQSPLFRGTAAFFSVGTVAVNGQTPVDVSWPALEETDFVFLTRIVDGGTPGPTPTVAKTAGQKFTVVAATGDTSTYEYYVGSPPKGP